MMCNIDGDLLCGSKPVGFDATLGGSVAVAGCLGVPKLVVWT